MRTFTDFEKKIINKLLTLDKENCNCICVQNILADQTGIIGKPTDFEFETGGSKNITLYYYRDINIQDRNDKEFVQRLEKQLYDFVLLMDFLIDEKYVFKIPENLHSSPSKNHAYEKSIPLDSKLENMLGQLWDNKFKVLFKLEELKKHNFLDSDLYREQKSHKLTIVIAAASILGSIFSCLINPIISCHSVQKVSVKELEEIIRSRNIDNQSDAISTKTESKSFNAETVDENSINNKED